MHPIQNAIIRLFANVQTLPLKLRWIAREIGEQHPQKIKYHLQQMEKHGLLAIDVDNREIIKTEANIKAGNLVSLPIMGEANCGRATALAENLTEGFLKISRALLPREKRNHAESLFVLRASGDSMNDVDINGKNIEDGDFIIIEKTETANNKEVIVSIVDGCANIKRFFKQGKEIILASDSKHDYTPIFVHENDGSYQIAGKVLQVMKKPNL